MTSRSPLIRRYRSHLIALEPRMMFDAAAAVAMQDAAADGAAAGRPDGSFEDAHRDAPGPADAPDRGDARSGMMIDRSGGPGSDRMDQPVTADADTDADARDPAAAPNALIFIDTTVADYRQLAAEWADRGTVILIDGTRDGIDQMRAALAGRSEIAAIHIVSHGTEGAFWLGTTRIDTAAITGDLAASLGAIGRALAADGDILIYGCDFAEGADGARAVAAFARATQADVAASTDVTGFAARGGDWTLEAEQGAIEATALSSADWAHTLDPNVPVPIAVTADSLTVRDAAGTVVATGTTGYDADARSPDVGVGATALWTGAAVFQGRTVDLRATVVSLSTGDAVRFSRPTGTGPNGDDPTFLLRDLTTGATAASVEIRWELIDAATGQPLPANVQFTIADIDGIGGEPGTRESVTASTAGLAYFTRERVSNIHFTSTLDAITASGTQNENTTANQPLTPQSAATFDWSDVSAFTLRYTLAPNAVTSNAQFFHDGDADFRYTDPVYVSVPRLDLDGNDSTAAGNDARFVFTENGPDIAIVDDDLVVRNPMDVNAITGATVTLENARTGDGFTIGALPAAITATIGPVTNGMIRVTLSGAGSEQDYRAALQAIRFGNTSDTPDPVQRVLTIAFSNDTLTSAVATSRIDVVPVNDAPVATADGATTAEDTGVRIAVLANDRDPDGDPLSVTAATADNGTVVRNADGTLTYTPNANFHGTDMIRYTIGDGQGGASDAIVTVTVTPVNDAPVAAGSLPDRAAQDGAAVSYATAGAFADGDGDALSYAATGLPAGLAIDAATGIVSGTIDRSASQANGGRHAVTVTARDPAGATATQRFTIQVANPAPIAADDKSTTTEDRPVRIAVLANDRDPDGDPLSVTAAAADNGTVVRNADGTLTYTPNANFNGTDRIRYTIGDGQGGTADAIVTVTVTAVNDAPVAAGSLPDRAAQDGAAVSYATAGGFADGDGDVLTYAATGLPAGLAIDAATGVVSGTIDRSASQANGGRHAVTVTARDPAGATATQRFTIQVANPAPIATDDDATTAEDRPVRIAVLANDRDPDGDPLSVTAAAADNGTVVRNADGTLTYTPNANFNGTDMVRYTIGDGQGGTADAIATVTVTPVNDAPVARPVPLTHRTVDGAAIAVSVVPAFGDPDGDALVYAATGLPAGLAIDAATGLLSGTVDRSASQQNGGRYTVTITATDPANASVTQTAMLIVANPGPSAADDSATTVEEMPVRIAVLANDRDPDGDPLSVTAAAADNGTVVRNADGTLTYTPNADFHGTDRIRYTIDDGQGGTADAIVTVTVTPVNDAPVAAGSLPDRTVPGGTMLSFSVADGFGDADGDRLVYAASGLPAGLAIDAVTGVISGTIEDGAIRNGPYRVIVTAADGGATAATQRFTITVANRAPIATDDAAATRGNQPIMIDALANDRDPDGDPLAIVAASAVQGTVRITADGQLRYTPPAGYVGRDTIRYSIDDGRGGTAIATVTIDVGNAPPGGDGLPDFAAREGQAVLLPAGQAFADPDGDQLSFSATGLPPGLTIDPATGTISGTIDRAAAQVAGGVYDSVITASDGRARETVPLRWTITNPAPIAADDRIATDEDAPIAIRVLANDGDPDGDPLTILSAVAGRGTVRIEADGTIRYTPDRDFAGTDVIAYTIGDGQGGQASASVTVTVAPVDDAPVTGGLPGRITADAAIVAVPVAAAFVDADGDRLVYSATGLPPGLAIDPETGVIGGRIAPGSAYGGPAGDGVYRATVTATDASGRSVSAPFDWTVLEGAPLAADDRVTTAEDVPVTIAVLANDSDPDGDPLTIVAAVADRGSVTIRDGALIYTPDVDFTGAAAITYIVADPRGNRAGATVIVDVTPVNDAPVSAVLPAAHASDGQRVTLDIGAFFGDPDGDALRFAAAGLPEGLRIDPVTGRVSGVIDPAASRQPDGLYRVTITATDAAGARTDSRFDWFVANPVPVATDDATTGVANGTTTIPVLANDRDPDGDPLTVIAAGAGHGVATIRPDGAIDYTPDAGFSGTDVIVYTIEDGQGGRASASVLVTVAAANAAPVAIVPDPVVPTGVDGATIAIDPAGWFRDPDGDGLTYAATGLPAGLTIDPASGAIRGVLDRSASQSGGAYPVTVVARDPAGATARVTFTLTVVNPGPIAVDDAVRTDREVAVVVPVLGNDRDPDGDPLTVVAAGAGNGTVAIGRDGTLLYTPDAGFTGSDIIRYTIADGEGGTATAQVTVTVAPVNDAPIAVVTGPVAAAADGGAVAVDAAAWFRDPDGDGLTYAATGLPAGLTIDPVTGAIRGVLDRSASQNGGGVYAITVVARDPAGATARVTFTLTVANPGPIAVDDAVRTVRDGAVVVPVLDNDRDPDGDPLRVIAAVAANGTVSIDPDGTIRYVPAASFAGEDVIRYTISDGQGGTARAIVRVTIDPVNRVPVIAGRDPIDATGGRPILIDVLGGVTDADRDRVVVTGATAVAGAVTVGADGRLIFTPALGFVGTTTIGYTVSDGQGGIATGTLVVRVADGRGADIAQLLRFGQVQFRDPTPALATIRLPADGVVRNPLSLIGAVDAVRPLRGTGIETGIGAQTVGAAVNAIRPLRGTTIDPDAPITAEVARLEALRDQRDAGDRLFDQRWGDFLVKGLTGFSAAADQDAGIMMESVVRGGAIYLEVRDIAADGERAPIRTIDVRLATGGRVPDWIRVDPRGLAIIERAADSDELHLIVRVTRTDGRTSATPILIQGATGEIELDRGAVRARTAAPLDATLASSRTAAADAAARLASHFE